jgi:WD40 repeat protein/serine/threonine protein kinase
MFSGFRNIFKKDRSIKQNKAETAMSESSPKPARSKEAEQKDDGVTLAKPSNEKPKASGTELRQQVPEQNASEMAERQDWDIKQLKTWKKGDVILDTYTVENILAGGMGYIYIANHKDWHVKMAIKSPNEMMLSNRAFFARVLLEADEWIKLGLHPNIAYCYYVRQIEEIPHIFIEYVDGGNLREWIADARCYDLKTGLALAIQFCNGIGYAHRHGMIHRDIKPENILMTKDGILKITDFGTARIDKPESDVEGNVSSSGDGLTAFGAEIGTYDYMSPEQYDDPRKADARDDIFSFGVCMYEMLCGRLPYGNSRGEMPASVIARLDGKNAYEPSSLRKDLPSSLVSLLKRNVSLNREERHPSAEELRDELIWIYRELFSEEPPHIRVAETGLQADGLNNRGVSLAELGKAEDALSQFDGALKSDPMHPESIYNRGLILWRSGMVADDALVTQLEESKKAHPGDWRAEYLLGLTHIERGDAENAINELESALLHSGGIPEVEFAIKLARDGIGKWMQHIRVFEGHTDAVESVSISPDGRHVLSGSRDKTIRLWELSTGNCIRTLQGHTGPVSSLAISPDSRYIVSGSWDKTLRLWELSTGSCIRTFEGHTDDVSSVAISPDGRYVLSAGWDKTLRLWELSTGNCIRTFEGHTGGVSSVAISPDGRYVLSTGWDITIRLWELSTGNCIRTFRGHTFVVNSVSISLDGRYALSGSADKTIRIWEVSTGNCIRTFQRDIGEIEFVAFSSDGRYMLSGGRDHTIRLWELSTGNCIRTLQGHTGPVSSLAISPDSRYIVSGSWDKTLRLWRLGGISERMPFIPVKPRGIMELNADSTRFNALISESNTHLSFDKPKEAYTKVIEAQQIPGYSQSSEALDLLYRIGMNGLRSGIRSGWHIRTFKGHNKPVRSLAISPDGMYVMSGSIESIIRLWELSTGECIRTLQGHTSSVTSVSFSPDGRYAVSGSADNTIRIWELSTGECIGTLQGHTSSATSVSFSPDGEHALSGGSSFDKTLRLWELSTGECIRTFAGHTDHVDSVTFSPNGMYILSSSWDKTIRLWELSTGECIKTFQHTGKADSLAVSPDGRYVMSGGSDKTIQLWVLSTGNCIRTLQGHTSSVTSVSFSPNGRYMVSGSVDNTIRLWELSTGECIRTFEGHIGDITSVTFSPDGRYILSGSWDETIRLWELEWEYEFPEPADWDEGTRPYLEIFLTLHTPYESPDSLVRKGKPVWTEEDFGNLIKKLQYAGYGWLRPEGVRRELEKMASNWQMQ